MDRLFIIGFDGNGHYDQRDVDVLNHFLEADEDREIYEKTILPNEEIMITVIDYEKN